MNEPQLTDSQLVEEYRPFVLSIAKKLQHSLGVEGAMDDFIAAGMRGLLEAHRRFDASRGVRFSTFAYYRVRGAIVDELRKSAYLPRRAYAKLLAAERADGVCEEAGDKQRAAGQPLSAAESAGLVDQTLTKISASFVLSALAQDQDNDQGDSPEEAFFKRESTARLHDALNELEQTEPRGLALIRGHYFEGKPFEEVALEIGVSKSWASRLHAKALQQLQRSLKKS